MANRTARRVLAACLGVGWFTLGFLSDSVPFRWGEPFWVLCCSYAAGSAFALAHFTTMFALKNYTIAVATIGLVRTVSYGNNGAWGPGVIWFILTITTVAAAAALVAQHFVAGTGGGGDG